MQEKEYNIKTSYFKAAANIPNSVSVCANTPPWFSHAKAKELICDKKMYNDFFKRYKMSEEEFVKKYREETLNQLNPYEILEKYNNRIFLGWYALPNFDTRFIITDWIKETTGIEIPEMTKEDLSLYVI